MLFYVLVHFVGCSGYALLLLITLEEDSSIVMETSFQSVQSVSPYSLIEYKESDFRLVIALSNLDPVSTNEN